MGDLISRSALLKSIEGVEVSFYLDDGVCGDNYDDTTIVDIINEQPTIEAVPVVYGEWLKEEPDEHGNRKPKCSVCGKYRMAYWSDYVKCNSCPECGAIMRKGGAK